MATPTRVLQFPKRQTKIEDLERAYNELESTMTRWQKWKLQTIISAWKKEKLEDKKQKIEEEYLETIEWTRLCRDTSGYNLYY